MLVTPISAIETVSPAIEWTHRPLFHSFRFSSGFDRVSNLAEYRARSTVVEWHLVFELCHSTPHAIVYELRRFSP
jgi:hypothetical protein